MIILIFFLYRSQIDYTIFFRLLSHLIIGKITLIDVLNASMYGNKIETSEHLRKEWESWFCEYLAHFQVIHGAKFLSHTIFLMLE